jgi:hypothetical protein
MMDASNKLLAVRSRNIQDINECTGGIRDWTSRTFCGMENGGWRLKLKMENGGRRKIKIENGFGS